MHPFMQFSPNGKILHDYIITPEVQKLTGIIHSVYPFFLFLNILFWKKISGFLTWN